MTDLFYPFPRRLAIPCRLLGVAALAFGLAAAATADPGTAAGPEGAPHPRLVLLRSEYQLGTLVAGPRRLMINFPVRNAGKAPLHLAARSGCPCILAWPDREIPPGKTGFVQVGLATIRLRGEQAQSILLETDDPQHRTATLTIRGNFLEPAESEAAPETPSAAGPVGITSTLSPRIRRRAPGFRIADYGTRTGDQATTSDQRPTTNDPAWPVVGQSEIRNPQSAIGTQAHAGPKLSTSTLRKDAGEVTAGESIEAEFPLTNTGTGVLKIEQVTPSCHCTTTSYPETLQPGETGALKVKVTTYALSAGPLEKQVMVSSNDPAQPRLTLEIVARLRPLVHFDPQNPLAVTYKKGDVIRRVFTVTAAAGSSVKIDGVTPAGPETQARILPAESSDPPGLWRVEVTVRPPASGGDFSSTLTLRTTDPAVPTIPLTIAMFSEDTITAAPARLHLDRLGSGPGSTSLSVFSLFRRGTPFRVLEVKPDSPALEVDVRDPYTPGAAAGGSFYMLTVHYRGGWEKGKKSGKIVVTTDDGASPKIEIPYEATVE